MAISLVLDHFKAVKHWASRHGARAHLDMVSFQLVIECDEQVFRLHPLFPAKAGEQFVHVSALADNVIGFGGWLPYRPYTARWSTDKLLFKQDAAAAGLLTPRRWAPQEQPDADFILKRSEGSFGYDISGPYRANEPVSDAGVPNPRGRGEVYAEQFVEGRMLKIWYWGRQPFFVHTQDYPLVEGDGHTAVAELVSRKISQDVGAAALVDMAIVEQCLHFQGLAMADIPVAGRTFWIDFRYGRTFQDRRRPQDGNALDQIAASCGEQLAAMGAFVEGALLEVSPVSLMTSVDAVLDASNRLWWLEMNTNSVLPHHGYEFIFAYLFDKASLSKSGGAEAAIAPALF